jgi:ABC-type transport system, involved in lipoprotein release, permease component
MRTNLQIALRFLLAKKRSMAMSLVGIAFGVGFIVLTQAVTTGFQAFFIQTILGTDGAIRVEDKFQSLTTTFAIEEAGTGEEVERVVIEANRRYQEGVSEPRLLRETLERFPEILGVSEVLRGSVRIQSATREGDAQVMGIELDDHLRVSKLGEQIVMGSLDDFRSTPSGILMGRDLAERLRVSPGNSVVLTYAGQSTRYRVSAIYETGVREIDRVRIFLHIGESRLLLKRPYGASLLQIALHDPDRAPEVAKQIERVVSHRATEWQYREKLYLDLFVFFRAAAAIMVSTIIIVSGLGMFNTLAMIVMEKTKDIAILRSMGFTREDIAAIFMLQGLLVLGIGVLAGWAIGMVSTYVVSSVPIAVRGIFVTDHVVVAWNFDHYIGAALAALVVVFIASWLPSRRAARLEPAAIIRGASQ